MRRSCILENDFSVLQISERRAKAASSLRASIAANAARVPSRPARSWKSIKRPMYDHQCESKVTRDDNALKRKTVPFARLKASKAAAAAQPISKKPRLADSPMPPLRHPTDAVPSAAPDREPAATPPPPPFAAAARAAAAPAPVAHSASNFAASGEAEDDAIVSDPGSLSRIHTLSKYPLSRLVSLAAPEVKAKDNGKRPNTMEDRWDNQLSTAVLSGDKCVYCLLPTGDDDKLCDNGREGNQCRLSFHDLCYKQHWNEIKAYKKCICRHCAVCTCGLVLRKEVVGDVQSATPTCIWSVPASWTFTALAVTMLFGPVSL